MFPSLWPSIVRYGLRNDFAAYFKISIYLHVVSIQIELLFLYHTFLEICGLFLFFFSCLTRNYRNIKLAPLLVQQSHQCLLRCEAKHCYPEKARPLWPLSPESNYLKISLHLRTSGEFCRNNLQQYCNLLRSSKSCTIILVNYWLNFGKKLSWNEWKLNHL